MRLPASLTAVAATFALVAAGCSSSGPDIPGSGLHQSASSGGDAPSSSGGSGSGAASSSASSGSGSSSGTGGSSSSSSSGGGGGGGTTMTGNQTWTDGQTLPGSVTIAAGATVTISPGATVNVPAGAVITVQGTLTASSATPTHAKLTGSSWGGIVVASGGTLTLDGVDMSGASSALDVQKGAMQAEYDDGTIDSATAPFVVEGGAALTTKHGTVTKAMGGTSITGSFTASHLDYDSNGHEGITTLAPDATLSIEDSTLHGSGPVADFLISSGAATFHVAYTDIKDVHCGFHFNSITAFDISYTNVESNAYGFMLYGSGGAGPRTISYSNIDQNQVAYDTEGTNGPITVDHCYVTGMVQNGTAVSVSNQQSATLTGTGPRSN
jgi:hypothetical protein